MIKYKCHVFREEAKTKVLPFCVVYLADIWSPKSCLCSQKYWRIRNRILRKYCHGTFCVENEDTSVSNELSVKIPLGKKLEQRNAIFMWGSVLFGFRGLGQKFSDKVCHCLNQEIRSRGFVVADTAGHASHRRTEYFPWSANISASSVRRAGTGGRHLCQIRCDSECSFVYSKRLSISAWNPTVRSWCLLWQKPNDETQILPTKTILIVFSSAPLIQHLFLCSFSGRAFSFSATFEVVLFAIFRTSQLRKPTTILMWRLSKHWKTGER